MLASSTRLGYLIRVSPSLHRHRRDKSTTALPVQPILSTDWLEFHTCYVRVVYFARLYSHALRCGVLSLSGTIARQWTHTTKPARGRVNSLRSSGLRFLLDISHGATDNLTAMSKAGPSR